MPASSKQQQKFMGMVHSLQKGDMKPSDASAELKKVAKDMDSSDVKDFASTKHKGLPKKVKQEIVRRLKEYAMMKPNHQTKVSAPADSLRSDYEMDVDKVDESIISEKLDTDLEKKYGITLDIYEYPDYLDLTRIIVPKDKRGEGIGTKAMKDIISYAKKTKKDIFLTPSSDFGGSKGRLVQFYKSFGFKDNHGRNRDFRSKESMKLTIESISENFPTNWLVGRVSDQHTKLGTTPRQKFKKTNFDTEDSGQEDMDEAYNKGEIFGGKLKIGGVSVPLEVELLGADNKKKVFITKVVHIDSKYHSKLPSNGILEIPARIFRTPGGGWYKVKTKSAFENVSEYGSNATDTFLLPRHSDKLDGTPEDKNAIDNPDTEDGKIHEVADGDWHFKAIAKLYKKAGSFGRKKIAVVITRNPYSTWDKIAKELKYSDYEEVTEYTDKLGLTEIVENLIKKHKK